MIRHVGWLAAALVLAGCDRSTQAGPEGRIDIAVTEDGFTPAQATVKVGAPVTLRVTRKVDATCATQIVIKDYGIDQPLPRDQPVEVTFTPTRPGKIRFACAMDMIAGELTAR